LTEIASGAESDLGREISEKRRWHEKMKRSGREKGEHHPFLEPWGGDMGAV
jgi:hypothetical protein